MTNRNYMLGGLAIVGGVGLALWAGLPAALMLILLVCPLMMFFMMFFMMRGMHGGTDSKETESSHANNQHAGAVDRSDGT